MDLRKLRYFIAVAEEQHIGRAAERLNISQPPLTRQIHQLEDELGVGLFNRTPKGMEVTAAGYLFLSEARNILTLVEQATERTQRAGKGLIGRLDVATFGSAILDTIPKILLAFRKAYPEVRVVLHSMEKQAQIEALRQKRITVGFNRMVEPLPDIATEKITTEKLLLAVNSNTGLTSDTPMPFKSIAQHPLILFPSHGRPNFIDKTLRLCQEAHFYPEISQEVGDAVTAVSLVASGFGVCLVPESATSLTLPNVHYVPLTDLPEGATVDLSCIYLQDDTSPLLASFLDTVRQFKDSP